MSFSTLGLPMYVMYGVTLIERDGLIYMYPKNLYITDKKEYNEEKEWIMAYNTSNKNVVYIRELGEKYVIRDIEYGNTKEHETKYEGYKRGHDYFLKTIKGINTKYTQVGRPQYSLQGLKEFFECKLRKQQYKINVRIYVDRIWSDLKHLVPKSTRCISKGRQKYEIIVHQYYINIYPWGPRAIFTSRDNSQKESIIASLILKDVDLTKIEALERIDLPPRVISRILDYAGRWNIEGTIRISKEIYGRYKDKLEKKILQLKNNPEYRDHIEIFGLANPKLFIPIDVLKRTEKYIEIRKRRELATLPLLGERCIFVQKILLDEIIIEIISYVDIDTLLTLKNVSHSWHTWMNESVSKYRLLAKCLECNKVVNKLQIGDNYIHDECEKDVQLSLHNYAWYSMYENNIKRYEYEQ